jgi:hypothetical protein
VDAQDGRAVAGGDEMRGERAADALRGFGRRDRIDEALARGADQQRQAEAPEFGKVAETSDALVRRLAEADAGVEACAAISSERAKNATTSATMSMSGSALSRLCMTMTGTPRRATSGAIAGSRCSPQTSLTMAAPWSSAQPAISALMVSIETGRPSFTTAGSTGFSRASSSAAPTPLLPP